MSTSQHDDHQQPTAGTAAATIQDWPQESREAARLVLDAHGEPDEVTPTHLVWHQVGPWKRMVASRSFSAHDFPAPHVDCVESFLDYRVPVERVEDLVRFDGSVVVRRTEGEISARCHDEQANFLALNLAHDIVTGAKDVQEARDYYGTEFLDARRKRPTPYMEGLRFEAQQDAADPGERILSDEQLDAAVEEGKSGGKG